jgi:uncharacterized membrane protein
MALFSPCADRRRQVAVAAAVAGQAVLVRLVALLEFVSEAPRHQSATSTFFVTQQWVGPGISTIAAVADFVAKSVTPEMFTYKAVMVAQVGFLVQPDRLDKTLNLPFPQISTLAQQVAALAAQGAWPSLAIAI